MQLRPTPSFKTPSINADILTGTDTNSSACQSLQTLTAIEVQQCELVSYLYQQPVKTVDKYIKIE